MEASEVRGTFHEYVAGFPTWNTWWNLRSECPGVVGVFIGATRTQTELLPVFAPGAGSNVTSARYTWLARRSTSARMHRAWSFGLPRARVTEIEPTITSSRYRSMWTVFQVFPATRRQIWAWTNNCTSVGPTAGATFETGTERSWTTEPPSSSMRTRVPAYVKSSP